MSPNLYENQAVEGIDQEERPDLTEQAPAPPPQSRKSRFNSNRSNLFLIGLFVAGAVAVYALSLRKGPSMASASVQDAEKSVDGALSRMHQQGKGGPGAGRTQDLIDGFYKSIAQSQVPLDGLAKNPFVFTAPRGVAVESPTGPTTQTPEKTPEQVTLEKAQSDFKTLRLQSVMMGRDGGSAIISNNLLTVGQQIKCFTVTSVTPKAVYLKWQDKEFVLSMQ